MLKIHTSNNSKGLRNIKATYESPEEETGIIYHNDLRIQNPGVELVDTRLLSDLISYIYEGYDK